MRWKSHTGAFFLLAIGLIVIYSLSSDLSKSGKAYTYSGRLSAGNIYDFFVLAKAQPDDYTLVIGLNSKDYEITYGKEIADYLGVKLRYEDEVRNRYDIILLGNPETNGLIGTLLTKPYSEDEAMVTLGDKNLLFLIVSSKQQAKKISEVITNFDNEQEMLSPDTVSFGFGGMRVYLVVLFLVLVGVLILFIERHRLNLFIHVHNEAGSSRLGVLRQYVKKYEDEGYSHDKIKESLVNRGYDADLVNSAMEVKDNARADISN